MTRDWTLKGPWLLELTSIIGENEFYSTVVTNCKIKLPDAGVMYSLPDEGVFETHARQRLSIEGEIMPVEAIPKLEKSLARQLAWLVLMGDDTAVRPLIDKWLEENGM